MQKNLRIIRDGYVNKYTRPRLFETKWPTLSSSQHNTKQDQIFKQNLTKNQKHPSSHAHVVTISAKTIERLASFKTVGIQINGYFIFHLNPSFIPSNLFQSVFGKLKKLSTLLCLKLKCYFIFLSQEKYWKLALFLLPTNVQWRKKFFLIPIILRDWKSIHIFYLLFNIITVRASTFSRTLLFRVPYRTVLLANRILIDETNFF